MGFSGVLGHEFVGQVESVHDDADKSFIGQRVCGEINVVCGSCHECEQGGDMKRNHCSKRGVVGILGYDGVYSEYIALPISNLHVIPASISDERAVFVEPLAAACRILEQGLIKPDDKVAVLGDGKLGVLCAAVAAHHVSSKLNVKVMQSSSTSLLKPCHKVPSMP
ncbi:unnamed protein product [Chrysoparadoxa australica]